MGSSDASSFGLGAVLMQKQPSGEMRPVAYASRSMTEHKKIIHNILGGGLQSPRGGFQEGPLRK